jgi:hypothetical protein
MILSPSNACKDSERPAQVEISLASRKLLNLFKAQLMQHPSERFADRGGEIAQRALLEGTP